MISERTKQKYKLNQYLVLLSFAFNTASINVHNLSPVLWTEEFLHFHMLLVFIHFCSYSISGL